MGKVKIYVFCLFFYLLSRSLCFSEVITLKSGKKVEGKITEQTNKYVKLSFQGVEVIYFNDEIVSIDQTASAKSTNALIPPIELLYKAYNASLDASKKPKEDKSNKIVALDQGRGESVSQGISNNQTIFIDIPILDLSGLPIEYQEMMKSAMVNSVSNPEGKKKN
jgi:hypothetical protein